VRGANIGAAYQPVAAGQSAALATLLIRVSRRRSRH
jgi:hypothetical protein